MSDLIIVEAGDPILRRPARSLSAEEIRDTQVQALLQEMREAMHAVGGVGLSAPQAGTSCRLFIVEDPTADPPIDFRAFINPELSLDGAEPAEDFEGCLSVPGFQAKVPRARRVVVRALDDSGRAFELEANGWLARILQHELDHLDGVLFVDRMDSRTLTTRPNFDRYWRATTAEDATFGEGGRAQGG